MHGTDGAHHQWDWYSISPALTVPGTDMQLLIQACYASNTRRIELTVPVIPTALFVDYATAKQMHVNEFYLQPIGTVTYDSLCLGTFWRCWRTLWIEAAPSAHAHQGCWLLHGV